MKTKKVCAALLALSVAMAAMPISASAADKEADAPIQYEQIRDLVLKNNTQLEVTRDSVKELKDNIDDISGMQQALQNSMSGLSSISSSLSSIIANPSTTDDVRSVATASLTSIRSSVASMESQFSNLNNYGMQIQLAELGYEKAERSLISAAESLFVLDHQLALNYKQLEEAHKSLKEQYELAKVSFAQGLMAESDLLSLELALLEMESSYAALEHQGSLLNLQFKTTVGLPYNKEITFSDVPAPDMEAFAAADLDKDTKTAIDNSLGIKLTIAGFGRVTSYTLSQRNDIKMSENEVVIGMAQQYYKMHEASDTLTLSQKKLEEAEQKLALGQKQFDQGMLSQSGLNSLKSTVESQKITVALNTGTLFSEIESYQNLRDGLS